MNTEQIRKFVLKALFKAGADELTFARAVEIAADTEDAAKVA